MVYEKQTWTTGEVITQEKLNHMEDGIASAGGDAGYECKEEATTYFNGNVTVEEHVDQGGHTVVYGEFSTTPSNALFAFESIDIELNGESYTLPKTYGSDGYRLFGIDEPIQIAVIVGGNYASCALQCNTGTYSLKVMAISETVTPTPCFENAVSKVMHDKSETVIVQMSVRQTGETTYEITSPFSANDLQRELLNGRVPIPSRAGTSILERTGVYAGTIPGEYGGNDYVFLFFSTDSTFGTLTVEKCIIGTLTNKYEKKTIALN